MFLLHVTWSKPANDKHTYSLYGIHSRSCIIVVVNSLSVSGVDAKNTFPSSYFIAAEKFLNNGDESRCCVVREIRMRSTREKKKKLSPLYFWRSERRVECRVMYKVKVQSKCTSFTLWTFICIAALFHSLVFFIANTIYTDIYLVNLINNH